MPIIAVKDGRYGMEMDELNRHDETQLHSLRLSQSDAYITTGLLAISTLNAVCKCNSDKIPLSCIPVANGDDFSLFYSPNLKSL